MVNERLKQQVDFLLEIDKQKQIFRQNYLADGSRTENDAEHSWHMAVMAILLSEYSGDIDLLKVIKMALIHDLVEIYAGDTYCYGNSIPEEKHLKEELAAENLFGMLPNDQMQEFKQLWEEFEESLTPESRFAAGLDRFQPLLLNHASKGKSWIAHRVTKEKVAERNLVVKENYPEIWNYIEEIINDSAEKGYLI